MQWKNKGYEYYEFGHQLVHYSRLILCGIGKNAQEILQILDTMREDVHWEISFVDQDLHKQKDGYKGRKIETPSWFYKNVQHDDLIVVTPFGKIGELLIQEFQENGINKDNMVSGFDFLYHYLPIYFLYAANKVFFTSQSILPSTICNLNCRDCLNFTPYIKEHTVYDIKDVKTDIDLFFQAVDVVYRFQITGGEPFLYPEISELVSYIGEKYRNRIIRLEIVANATVLPTDELCEEFKIYDVEVILDDYTMSLPERQAKKHEDVVNFLEMNGISYSDNRVESWFRLYTPENLPAKQSEKELQQMFTRCSNPWSTLENGRISACNYALYAEKAGIIKSDASEYFDLRSYTKDKAKELIEFRTGYNTRGYVNLCKVCNGWASINKTSCKPAIQMKIKRYSDANE